MSTRTTNYNFIIGEGSDVVNPLTQIFPNFTSLDDILRDIADTGITTATELVTGTVHALTRTDANVSVFRFQATGNFTAGETFTVDGAQVTALDVSGETLRTGAYIIGSMVLCELRDTLLTVYTSGSTDAATLEGHQASYFATNDDLETVDDKADANKDLIDDLTENKQNKAWTRIGMVTGSANSLVIPPNATEIQYVASNPYYAWEGSMPIKKHNLMNNHVGIVVGGTIQNNQGIAIVQYYESNINSLYISSAVQDGSNNTSNATLEAWYR